MSTINKTLLSNQDIIIPKTRSEWIYRSDNTSSYENDIDHVNDIIRSGILYNGIHSKSGTIHTITGIPIELPNIFSIKFKATADYVDGDTFSINGISYVVNSNIPFIKDSINECNIDNLNRFFYVINKPLSEPPISDTKDLPQFTYSGQYETINDGDLGWRIKLLSSGTFTLISPLKMYIDVFYVGGGAGGQSGSRCGGGGPGGTTKTVKRMILAKGAHPVIIGSGGIGYSYSTDKRTSSYGGGQSSFNDNYTSGGNSANEYGGSGGSGGGGGGYYSLSGYGQGRTTREFGDSSGDLYSSGGGGGGYYDTARYNVSTGPIPYTGGNGGSDGNNATVPHQGGPAGGQGGTNAGNGGGAGGNGTNASYYGSGGGGGGYMYSKHGGVETIGSSGSGFQGIIILRNPR